jgi:serine/threonine-protein kinase
VAYWLVTGRLAFEGSSFYEIVSKHLHEAPEPPSRHAPNGVPRELDAVILRCLEKVPDQRPMDARELAREFKAVPLSQPWRDEDATAWWDKHLPVGSGVGDGPTEEARMPAGYHS